MYGTFTIYVPTFGCFVWHDGYTYMDQMGTSYYFRILILLEAKICWAAANFKSALKSFDFFKRPKKERALLQLSSDLRSGGCTCLCSKQE